LRRRAGAALGAVLIVSASAVVFTRASLQQDFAAYYVAGKARRAGLDPYVNHVQPGTWAVPDSWDGLAPFQHSRFLYPPLVAELFRPFAALPYAVAKAAFTALAVAAWLAAALVVGPGAAQALLVAGALFFPLYLHLERGQIDLFVLLLLAVTWRFRARVVVAGAALALAGLLKPAAFGLLPVVVALRHLRLAGAAAMGGLVLAGLSVAVSGPALARRYVADVLPRAALYGEGGTEAMLLPESRFPEARGDVYRESLWDFPASASLPRLLAPERPSPATALGPYLLALLLLVWAARRVTIASPIGSAELVYLAAAAMCVVTSSSGWAMGLVWALPIAPAVERMRSAGALPPRATLAMAAAWIACAVPAPLAGFPAVAGTALAIAAVAGAVAARPT
jgi:hypothetical protein